MTATVLDFPTKHTTGTGAITMHTTQPEPCTAPDADTEVTLTTSLGSVVRVTSWSAQGVIAIHESLSVDDLPASPEQDEFYSGIVLGGAEAAALARAIVATLPDAA